MKQLLVILAGILLFSCNEKVNHVQERSSAGKTIIKKGIVDSLPSKKLELKTKGYNSQLFFKDLDYHDLMKQADYVTTTFLSKRNILDYDRTNKRDKYFVLYFLSLKNSKNIPGYFVIYDSIKPYLMEKETGDLVEVTLVDPGIKLFHDKVGIGLPVDSLKAYFGENVYYEDANLICYRQDEFTACFAIEDGRVKKLRIGKFKKGISLNEIVRPNDNLFNLK